MYRIVQHPSMFRAVAVLHAMHTRALYQHILPSIKYNIESNAEPTQRGTRIFVFPFFIQLSVSLHFGLSDARALRASFLLGCLIFFSFSLDSATVSHDIRYATSSFKLFPFDSEHRRPRHSSTIRSVAKAARESTATN